mgnify:CR=1 FL=1
MKRNSYSTLAFAAVMVLGLLAGGLAVADPLTCPGYTPTPNSAILDLRVFDDCGWSELSYVNNYPTLVEIKDTAAGCTGTNLHVWSFSEDGVTKAAFENCSHYRFAAVVKLCSAYGEAGLRLSPWWSPLVDGRFMVNVGNGEVACFGGRLPFYSFSAAYGVRYLPGQAAWMQIEYDPNSLSEADPATIQYQLYLSGVGYSSPRLPFDMGNELEAAAHGLWGELYPAYAGGYMQAPNWNGGAAFCTAVSFTNIEFEGPSATPANGTTWGQLKNLYR